MLELELPSAELEDPVAHRIENLFRLRSSEREAQATAFPAALSWTEACFAWVDNDYFRAKSSVATARLSPYHASQYTIFLYFLSNEAASINSIAADKIYYLNKALNGLDLYHRVAMPEVFALDHPVGSVIGFGGRFFFQQNCTVGNSNDKYPTFGRNVTMLAGASVIGACEVSDNVVLAAHSYVKDTNIPGSSIVFGQWPNIVAKRAEPRHFAQLKFFIDACEDYGA